MLISFKFGNLNLPEPLGLFEVCKEIAFFYTYMKICRENVNLVVGGRKYRIIYMKT
jgi:hypothetical protein